MKFTVRICCSWTTGCRCESRLQYFSVLCYKVNYIFTKYINMLSTK